LEQELKVLQDLISETLHPTRLSANCLDKKYLFECKSQVFSEIEIVKKRIRDALIQCKKRRETEFVIDGQQSAIVALADVVYHYLHPNLRDTLKQALAYPTLVNIYNYVYQCIEDLLIFTEKNFASCFDWDFKITEFQRLRIAKGIGRNLASLNEGLRAIRADDGIINIISNWFKVQLRPESLISFRLFGYIKELHHRLSLIVSKKDNNSNEQIITLLVHLNFNSTEYYDYYILQLVNGAASLKNNTRELIEYYSWKIKVLNQTPIKAGFVNEPYLSSVKEQIGVWIGEELQYLERNYRLYPVSLVKDDGPVADTKVHTSLAVSQLSLVLKMLIDSNVITNKNYTQLMQMVARNFKTDRVEKISEDSLRNKSYSFESGTIAKVKDMVINLLNLVKSY
jgi:hypothetical protein